MGFRLVGPPVEAMDGEEWRDVAGFEGRYWVSSFGRVSSYRGLLRPSLNTGGYEMVFLCRGIKACRQVHRLVAEAFIGPRPDGMTVNHKDCNKLNNRLDNLEYCSAVDNIRHARRNGLYARADEVAKAIGRRRAATGKRHQGRFVSSDSAA